MINLFKEKKGITLIALVITIIILIILAGVTLGILFKENGIIDRAKEASFKSKLSEVEDKLQLYWQNKVAEEIMNGANYTAKQKLPLVNPENPVDATIFNNHLKDEIKDITGKEASEVELYIIDKTKINANAEHTYLLHIESMQIYDMEGEHFGGKWHHTLKGLGSTAEGGGIEPEKTIEPEISEDGDIGWLKPDFNGFNKNHTNIIYFNENDDGDFIEVKLDNYLNDGRLSKKVVDGKTYIFDGYKKKIWANIYMNANQIETYWVWIPRFAYIPDSVNKTMNIVFVDMNNNPIGERYKEKYTVNNDGTIKITEDGVDVIYTVHSAFDQKWNVVENGNQVEKTKKLQGIWMSKYQMTETNNSNVGNYSNICYAPVMTGFNENNTYIELWNEATEDFVYPEDNSQLLKNNINNLNALNNGTNYWYDYSKKVWANVKTVANGIECWWVWIPRYAYYPSSSGKEMEVIFVDVNNKPMDTATFGNKIPDGYIVHSAFTKKDGTQLKGIWMSKYQMTETNNSNISTYSEKCLPPDMTGFDPNCTYIELWDESTEDFVYPENNSQLYKNVSDLSTLNSGTNKWYDYSNKIWANIRTVGGGYDCWWVWIPRYAYYPSDSGKEMQVIFVDLNDKPMDKEKFGNELPAGFTVHSAFNTKDGKKLQGIWMSKYQMTDIGNEAGSASITNISAP